MHRALLAHWAPVSTDTMATLAGTLGLNIDQFRADLRDTGLMDTIREDRVLGQITDVVGTPTLFLGTRRRHGKLIQARLVPLLAHYLAPTLTPHQQVVIVGNGYN